MIPLNIHSNSASAMKTILDLHFPEGTILDVNYSLGTFYKNVDRDVVGVDIRVTGNVIADNKFLPFPDDIFEIGVCDPPYKRGNGDQKYAKRYGEAPCTVKKATDQYFKLLPELLRVSKNGLIIKAQDETDGHKFYPRMFKLIEFMKSITNLLPHDIAYVYRSQVADNNIKGNQRHFMSNCVSYFLVYKWVRKFPFKPVRF